LSELDATTSLKKKMLKLLKEDEEFRYAVAIAPSLRMLGREVLLDMNSSST